MSPHLPLTLLAITSVLPAAPTGTNLGFEDVLNGWNHSGVVIETSLVHEGSKALNLQAGWIEQTISGLTPGSPHRLEMAYLDATPQSWLQGHAQILIDGQLLSQIHNGQDNEFLDGIGFEFTPSATQVVLRIEALPGDAETFIIDDIRISLGALPPPPTEDWANLSVMTDPRGGRRLVNGNFEATIGPAAADPYNSGPDGAAHLSRFSLPGWLVTQENVDLVRISTSNAPEGNYALDLGGHGPGGIAQTIEGLTPGAVYTVSFWYTGHAVWFFNESDVMTGELFANGQKVSDLSRDADQTWDDGYELFSAPVLADQDGKLTLKLISTTTDRGGNILYDDIRLSEGGDAFSAWTIANQIANDPDGNSDGDSFTHEFDFLLNQDPKAFDPLIVPDLSGPQRLFTVPLNGAALQQGYTLILEASTTLSSWVDPSTLGITILDDTSAPGTTGVRRYLLPNHVDQLFLRIILIRP